MNRTIQVLVENVNLNISFRCSLQIASLSSSCSSTVFVDTIPGVPFRERNKFARDIPDRSIAYSITLHVLPGPLGKVDKKGGVNIKVVLYCVSHTHHLFSRQEK